MVAIVSQVLLDRDEILRQLQFNLQKTQSAMKDQADKKSIDVFQVGDLVLVKLRPHRQQSVSFRIAHRLAPRYYGPFKIISRISSVAYKLGLPLEANVHPVFHVS